MCLCETKSPGSAIWDSGLETHQQENDAIQSWTFMTDQNFQQMFLFTVRRGVCKVKIIHRVIDMLDNVC